MPILDLQMTPDGAILDAFILVSAPRRQALLNANQALPSPIQARLLIDTGASCTCMQIGHIAPLGIPPKGQVQISTPTTGSNPSACYEFDVGIAIPLPPAEQFVLGSLSVIECQALDGPYDGLLGRDVLAHCTYFWNGIAGTFSIAF